IVRIVYWRPECCRTRTRKNEIESARGQRTQIPFNHQPKTARGGGMFWERDHAAGYVDADRVEAEVFQKARRASGAATEIQSFAPNRVLADYFRQIAVG